MDDRRQKLALIASLPPVVNAILNNMPAKQLNTCAQVCTLWRTIANAIRRKRRRVSWYFYYYCCDELPSDHSAPCYPIGKRENCLDMFIDNVEHLPSEPVLTLIFSTKALINGADGHFFPSRMRKRRLDENSQSRPYLDVFQHAVIGSLFPHLPKNCDIGFCTSRGITGTTTNNSCIREIEFCPAYAAVHFPKLLGVTIYKFPLSGIRCAEPLVFDEHTGVPDNVPIKCLLIFVYDRIGEYCCLPYNKLIGYYLGRQNWKMALGGAYIEHMFFPKHKPRRRNQSYGIAFTGENVEAGSITITKDMSTESDIVNQFKFFRDSNLLQGQCIAFMFTCVGRGAGFYHNRADFESGIFRKLFPTIPLFGVFGNGEIGINHVPNQMHKNLRKIGSWMKSYASVFVILSFRS